MVYGWVIHVLRHSGRREEKRRMEDENEDGHGAGIYCMQSRYECEDVKKELETELWHLKHTLY